MGAVAIIPARLGSTRFPRKVLASETGQPLVQHVVDATEQCQQVDRIAVACDSDEIVQALKPFGTECVMTRDDHPNGTSRLLEAAEVLGLGDDQIVVNVQGDEPEIDPSVIEAAVRAAVEPTGVDGSPAVGTVASPFSDLEDPSNPAIVKAIVADAGSRGSVGRALYFTRACAPYNREGGTPVTLLKHVGIYAYPVRSLRRYAKLRATPLELAEQLEQLRWLEHGLSIGVAIQKTDHHGIDTPEQYQAFVARLAGR